MLSRTWESVELSWIHGFDGGYPQGFVVTYKTNTDENGRINVTPANSTKFNVTGKQMKYTKMIKRQCILSVAVNQFACGKLIYRNGKSKNVFSNNVITIAIFVAIFIKFSLFIRLLFFNIIEINVYK